ncbi:histamine H4 receptor-like [Saccoglossus kowalevskii]|uniref:Histamine H1 receptor-like n=1 Tax=Saccoglossus kowalevskii TaxID=10224 RepID=A0ABM0MTX2_SACKO|nr:PREDICTED: histamine H1 receptor-like [Saccoglossus kowalevskii]
MADLPSGLYSPGVAIFVSTILYTIVVASIFGNLLVIVAFFTDAKLRHTVRNVYLLNLAIADLMVATLSMPYDAFWARHGYADWPLGEGVCKLWLTADFTACSVSVISVIYISLDRYWLIKKKAKYAMLQKTKKAIIMCVIPWIFLSFYYGITISGWSALTGQSSLDYSWQCEAEHVNSLFFNVITVIFEFIIPSIAIAYLNMTVYLYIRTRKRTSNQNRVFQIHLNSENTVSPNESPSTGDEVPCGNRRITTTRYMSEHFTDHHEEASAQIDQELSNPLVASRRTQDNIIDDSSKRGKAGRTLGLVVAVFVSCWLPYNMYLIVITLCDSCYNEHIWTLVNWLLWCNSTVNPLIYAVTTPRFCYAFKTIVCLSKKHSQVNIHPTV